MPHHNFFQDCRPKDSRTKTSHLQVYVGDTMAFRLVMNDRGTPIDISGWYFWWTVKDDINDADTDAIFRKELGSGISTPYPELGQVIITLDPADTIALQLQESKSYYWDLQYQDNFGDVVTVGSGKLTVLLGVTGQQGFNVGAGNIVTTNQLTGAPYTAGVNVLADGDGLSNNEQQSIHVSGFTGGTFTLTVDDPNNPGNPETTTPIAWNASAATIETVLETDITFIDGVTATGGPLSSSPVVIEFDGPTLTLQDVTLMSMDVSLLT